MNFDPLSAIAPLWVRFLFTAILLSGLAFADWKKNGKSATRYKEYLFLITCSFITILFAEIHDAITIRISPAYFAVGKGLGWANLNWEVAVLAIKGSYWVGLLLGLMVLISNNPVRGINSLSYAELSRFLLIPLAAAILLAVTFGCWYAFTLPDPSRTYSLVWGIHTGTYLGSGLGALVAIFLIARKRYRSREPNWIPPVSQFEQVDRFFLACLLFVLATEVFSSFLSNDWFFDLLIQYRWIRWGVILAISSWLSFRKSKRIGIVFLTIFALTSGLIFGIDQLRSSSAIAEASDSEVRSNSVQIISFNVLTSNTRIADTISWINSRVQPGVKNVVFLMEVNAHWVGQLAPLKKRLPYSYEAPREDNFGIAIYSDTPLEGLSEIQFDSHKIPAVGGVIKLAGKSVQLVGVHTLPPASERGFEARNQYFDNLRKYLDQSSEPVVVFGDLNCASYSKHLNRVLISASGKGPTLYSADKKIVRSNTWFGLGPIFAMPIDYVLHSEEFQSRHFEVGPDLGSDHRAIIATLAF